VSESNSNPDTKYPWQQAVLEALTEFRPDVLPQKVNEAQRAIAARLRDKTAADNEEQLAIRDALQSLRVLTGERTPAKQEPSGLKKDIA
jgi:hypothetical protein